MILSNDSDCSGGGGDLRAGGVVVDGVDTVCGGSRNY